VLPTSPHTDLQFNSSYRFKAYIIIAYLTFVYCQKIASTAYIDILLLSYTTSFPWQQNSTKNIPEFACVWASGGGVGRGVIWRVWIGINEIQFKSLNSNCYQLPNCRTARLVNVNMSWRKIKFWTVFTIEHKIQLQTQEWEKPDFIGADLDDTVTLLRHIYLEISDLLVWKTDTVWCRTSNGPLYQSASPGVTTEILNLNEFAATVNNRG
jgi:hypothetical protein